MFLNPAARNAYSQSVEGTFILTVLSMAWIHYQMMQNNDGTEMPQKRRTSELGAPANKEAWNRVTIQG